jgi:hypothetical protein
MYKEKRMQAPSLERVRETVAEIMADLDKNPDGITYVEGVFIGGLVTQRLGISQISEYEGTDMVGAERARRQHQAVISKIFGQAERALNAMAASGEIVKVRKGQTGPHGESYSHAKFYTKASFERATEQAAKRELAAEEQQRRVVQVVENLGYQGYRAHYAGDNQISISLADWEDLLGVR